MRLKIFAHRCGSITSAENTLEAVETACRLKVDGIECDVQLSKDGEIVLFHDMDTQRLTGVAGTIGKMTWSEIKSLRVHGRFRIPHLKEILGTLAAFPKMQCYLDLRRPSRTLVEALVKVLYQSGLHRQVFVLDLWSHRSFLLEAKKSDPRIRISLMPELPWSLLKKSREVGAQSLCLGWDRRWWTRKAFKAACFLADLPAEVSKAESAGVEVSGGIANTPEDIRWFLSQGISGIWTDDILLAQQVLENRKEGISIRVG